MSVPLRQIGRYELTERLGLSDTAEVYAARDIETGVMVAIKRALPHAWEAPEHRVRFEREITRVMAQTHHGLVRGIEVVSGPSTADPCLVMHWVEGVTLRALLDGLDVPPPPKAALVHLVAALADTLTVLHTSAEGAIVHGDISAGNVVAHRDGTFTVLDLGSAAGEGEPSADHGTPRYAPPERTPGAPLTTRGDIYSLGVLLWEVASGRRWPTEAPRHLPESSPISGTDIGALISRCIASDTQTRPMDAQALRALAAQERSEGDSAAWCQWLATAVAHDGSVEEPPSAEQGKRAWLGLTLGIGLTVWTALWFIAQMV